jgi:hypothetical protein
VFLHYILFLHFLQNKFDKILWFSFGIFQLEIGESCWLFSKWISKQHFHANKCYMNQVEKRLLYTCLFYLSIVYNIFFCPLNYTIYLRKSLVQSREFDFYKHFYPMPKMPCFIVAYQNGWIFHLTYPIFNNKCLLKKFANYIT